MVFATCSGYVYRRTADFLNARRCFLAASAVRGAAHGGHSWFHHYSVLYRDSRVNVPYLSRVIYSSVYLGTPTGAYRFLVCYIQSFVVDVLSSYRHIDSFGGMRLYSAIFRYISTRSYYARHMHTHPPYNVPNRSVPSQTYQPGKTSMNMQFPLMEIRKGM